VADRGWKRRFDDPIPLPRGRYLVTILVATLGGPTMFARIGIMRALNAGKPDPATIAVQKRERGIYRRIRGSEMQLAPTCFHSGAVKWPENDLQGLQYSRVKNCANGP
jgi:hypothetical protein